MDLLRRLLYFAGLLPSMTGIFGAYVARKANGIRHGFGFGFELRVRPGECIELRRQGIIDLIEKCEMPAACARNGFELCSQIHDGANKRARKHRKAGSQSCR